MPLKRASEAFEIVERPANLEPITTADEEATFIGYSDDNRPMYWRRTECGLVTTYGAPGPIGLKPGDKVKVTELPIHFTPGEKVIRIRI